MEPLIRLDLPHELDRPFLLVQMSGWSDAGFAAQSAVGFLRTAWNAEPAGHIDLDELLDYRSRRPLVRLVGGVIEAVEFAPLELLVGTAPDGRSALLLTGPEPDLRWHRFATEVTQLCQRLAIAEMFGLGAFPAPALHTDPVAVLGTSTRVELATRLDTSAEAIELPGGVQSLLEQRLGDAGIAATGLWARVPPYLAAGPFPAASLALVQALSRLLGISLDTADLESASAEHLRHVEQAAQERPQVAEMIDQMRQMVGDGRRQPMASGDDIAAELEQFLLHQAHPDAPQLLELPEGDDESPGSTGDS